MKFISIYGLNAFLHLFQLLGCVIIGYMAWVLATSVTVSQFLDGTLVSNILILKISKLNDFQKISEYIFQYSKILILFFQIFTYTVIALGFALFFSGLIGWVGGASESPFLVGLFLFFVVISMLTEIGGIIALKIAQLEVSKRNINCN